MGILPETSSPELWRSLDGWRATAAAIFLSVWASGSLAEPPAASLSEFARCQLRSLEAAAQMSAECATLTVAENPAEPNGQRIELAVARVKSLSPAPASDPLLLIAGGPGGSTIDMYLSMARAFGGVLDERDILLIDQRGTGRSAALTCSVDMSTMEVEPTPDDARQAAQECLADLAGDPRYYTTSVAVQDLEALRQAAGYSQLNLYGVSYGTRVAQHYLRRFPEQTRAVVLDGVVPADLALGPDIAINAQLTLERLFERCTEQENCRAAFPRLANNFATLSESLRESAPNVSFANPTTGTTEELVLQYSTLAMTIRLLSYAPETAALIPLTIAQAAQGEYTGLTGQAVGILQNLSSSLSYGMHNAVMCTEDAPFYDPQTIDLDALGMTYIGSGQVESIRAMCDAWPAGVLDADLKLPLQSATPVLLLSGEHDPITPPAYANRAAEGLSNAHHFVAPGQGHDRLHHRAGRRLYRASTRHAIFC